MRTVERRWPPTAAAALALPRHDIVAERTDDGTTFVQVLGPFSEYARTVRPAPDGRELVETTRYGYVAPVVRVAVRAAAALDARAAVAPRPRHRPARRRRRGGRRPTCSRRATCSVLGLLAAASMSSAFVNTLFTQTVNFAADDFGVSDSGVGIAGSLVRAGIVLVLPARRARRPHRAAHGSSSPWPSRPRW